MFHDLNVFLPSRRDGLRFVYISWALCWSSVAPFFLFLFFFAMKSLVKTPSYATPYQSVLFAFEQPFPGLHVQGALLDLERVLLRVDTTLYPELRAISFPNR